MVCKVADFGMSRMVQTDDNTGNYYRRCDIKMDVHANELELVRFFFVRVNFDVGVRAYSWCFALRCWLAVPFD